MEGSWPSNVNVIVKGFVNNMDEWMTAADCLVTKVMNFRFFEILNLLLCRLVQVQLLKHVPEGSPSYCQHISQGKRPVMYHS